MRNMSMGLDVQENEQGNGAQINDIVFCAVTKYDRCVSVW